MKLARKVFLGLVVLGMVVSLFGVSFAVAMPGRRSSGSDRDNSERWRDSDSTTPPGNRVIMYR